MRTKSFSLFLYTFFVAVLVFASATNTAFAGSKQSAAAPVFSNDSTRNLGAFKWYFTQPGEYFFAYEHVLSPKRTVEAGGGWVNKVYLPGTPFMFFGPLDNTGFSLRVHYRMYGGKLQKKHEAPFGFYSGPGITLRVLRPTDVFIQHDVNGVPVGERRESKSFQAFTLQYTLGFQFPMFDVMNISMFMGPGIRFKNVPDANNNMDWRITVPGLPVFEASRGSVLFTPVFNMGASIGFFVYNPKKVQPQ